MNDFSQTLKQISKIDFKNFKDEIANIINAYKSMFKKIYVDAFVKDVNYNTHKTNSVFNNFDIYLNALRVVENVIENDLESFLQVIHLIDNPDLSTIQNFSFNHSVPTFPTTPLSFSGSPSLLDIALQQSVAALISAHAQVLPTLQNLMKCFGTVSEK